MFPELPRCYVASPLGFTEAGRDYYRRVFLPALSKVVEPVDPWALSQPAEINAARTAHRVRELMVSIGQRNAQAIRESDVLVAVLDGQEPDSGTVAELGFATGLGKPCFGLRSDLRPTGDEGMILNLQVEYFIGVSGGTITTTLSELVGVLRNWGAS